MDHWFSTDFSGTAGILLIKDWFSKRVRSVWTRRTHWTPLLQNQREFQRSVAKERARVDRNGKCFGFIVLRVQDVAQARADTIQVARILHKRLRETDEKGHLGPGRLGILLPETGAEEADYVLVDLLKLLGEKDLRVEGEVFVYPDQGDRESPSEYPGKMRSERGCSITSKLAGMTPSYPKWKRGMDVLGASLGLVAGAPLIAILAVLVKVTSRGPVIFSQERTGYLGRPFRIYKIRTMVLNAEELKLELWERNERDGPAFKIRNDPRITRIGRFLRSTGLDELPQLYNVLMGDMSMVGPRPLPVEEAAKCLPWQNRRHEVKPGLTCFWQVSKIRDFHFSDWMRMDLKYSRAISFGLDVKLLTQTLVSVLLGRVGH